MTIRHAEDRDLLWLTTHDRHVCEEILKRKIREREIFIIEKENETIGWLRYNLFWDMIPFMNMLVILEDLRGKGFGKQLVRYWENEMREMGYKNVLTSTLSNEDAQNFYRKIGYRDIGGFTLLDEPLEIILHKML